MTKRHEEFPIDRCSSILIQFSSLKKAEPWSSLIKKNNNVSFYIFYFTCFRFWSYSNFDFSNDFISIFFGSNFGSFKIYLPLILIMNEFFARAAYRTRLVPPLRNAG